MLAIKPHSILLRLLIVTGLLLMTLLPSMQVCGSILADCAMSMEQVKTCCPNTNHSDETDALPVLIPGEKMQDCHPVQKDVQMPCNCDCQLTQSNVVYEQPPAVKSLSEAGKKLIISPQTDFLSFAGKAQPHSGHTVDIPTDTGSSPIFIRNCTWLI